MERSIYTRSRNSPPPPLLPPPRSLVAAVATRPACALDLYTNTVTSKAAACSVFVHSHHSRTLRLQQQQAERPRLTAGRAPQAEELQQRTVPPTTRGPSNTTGSRRCTVSG